MGARRIHRASGRSGPSLGAPRRHRAPGGSGPRWDLLPLWASRRRPRCYASGRRSHRSTPRPYVTMQAYNATYSAIAAARPVDGHGGTFVLPFRRPNDLPRPGAAGHWFVAWTGGPLRGALDSASGAYASSLGATGPPPVLLQAAVHLSDAAARA